MVAFVGKGARDGPRPLEVPLLGALPSVPISEHSYRFHERRWRTRSLSALPSTALPSRAALAALTTAPICFIEFAPVSAMALVMAACISAALAAAGESVCV